MNRIEQVREVVDDILLHMSDAVERRCAYLHLYGNKGAGMAEKIMKSLNAFTEEEIKIVCNAIYNHSDKDLSHASFDEVLKDADVMQHCLYNPLFPVKEQEKVHWEKLKVEFGLIQTEVQEYVEK